MLPADPDSSPEPLLRQAWDMPWKARNELERLLLLPLAWLSLRGSGIEIGPGWQLYGLPIWQKHRRSTLRIGARLSLRSSRRSNPLGPAHPCLLSTRRAGAVLLIGDDFGLTGGAIVCEEHISIGRRVTVGANSVIVDTDFHPLAAQQRQQHPTAGATAPVSIGDDVFIGMQALILKGASIGSGSVIGAGSVVTGAIPAGVIAAGNPARVIRAL
ncbi:MAG: acyltransferase [Anaerolineae bacterium]|jgi:acetyltransferase-like isoleucine patch superfamily enzyme|nr:acyltransferase [Anaerolineae bacterium]